MRRSLQRYTSLLLGVLLAAALWITPAAAAQSGRCGEGVEWSLDGGVLRISGHGAMTNYTDEDLPPWHESAGSITAAVVEQGVTTVGNLAFFGCSALGSVTLGGTVTGTVGIRVPNAGRQYATLYQDNEVIQTTIVDNDGIAWFSLANVDSKTKYYLGINASDADLNEAIIPDTLAQEYGAEYTLTDASGKQYQVTGRSSRWGITGSRFAIYVAVAIGGVVLIVTLIMVTINRFAKTKAHYAAKAAADDDAIDEDALRMQIMQEMLDEAQKRKKK